MSKYISIKSKYYLLFALTSSLLYFYLSNFTPLFGIVIKAENNNFVDKSQYNSSQLSQLDSFIKAMKSKTILSDKTFQQYRNESLRYLGQQQPRMKNLLAKIFQGKKSTLNILITGGSISEFRVIFFNFKFLNFDNNL